MTNKIWLNGFHISPEFIVVILASSDGARLFPLTSDGHDENDADENANINYIGNTDINDKEVYVKNDVSPPIERNIKGKRYSPKHLLPLAGTPILHHLLWHLQSIGLKKCIVAISGKDNITIESLTRNFLGSAKILLFGTDKQISFIEVSFLYFNDMKIYVVSLPLHISGSADALRYLSSLFSEGKENGKDGDSSVTDYLIPTKSHIMVMPGDIVLYGNNDSMIDVLSMLANAHREGYCHIQNLLTEERTMSLPPVGITMLLTDVGEADEDGTPLKENTKAKKGGIARYDEEIEYIALSSSTSHRKTFKTNSLTENISRVLFKQTKYNVEDDEENTGSTPKLIIPKTRLYSHNSLMKGTTNILTIRTDWSDVHIYILAPWVLSLLQARPCINDIQKDLLPLLVSRQFRGVKYCFGYKPKCDIGRGNTREQGERDALLAEILNQPPFLVNTVSNIKQQMNLKGLQTFPTTIYSDDSPFSVLAQVLDRASSKLILRACNIPSYLYCCKEFLMQTVSNQSIKSMGKNILHRNGDKDKPLPAKIFSLKNSSQKSSATYFPLPRGAYINAKFNYILLEGTTMGDNVQIKASTIGRNVKIGNRSRLNNVLVMDNVTIGENCILQNSIFSTGSIVGNNCNLNDCQIGSEAVILDGGKGKGESFMSEK